MLLAEDRVPRPSGGEDLPDPGLDGPDAGGHHRPVGLDLTRQAGEGREVPEADGGTGKSGVQGESQIISHAPILPAAPPRGCPM
ncbi:hypothetical protein GCM10009531_38060 [Actinoplanes capillaceus]